MNANSKFDVGAAPFIVTSNTQGRTTGQISFSLCKEAGRDYLNLVATAIRTLPSVLRVRMDQEQFRLEVLYALPAPGILREIYDALLSLRSSKDRLVDRMTV